MRSARTCISGGFTNEGVEKALKSFNATNRYAEIYGDSESYGGAAGEDPESSPDTPQQETAKVENTTAPYEPAPPQAGVDAIFWNKGSLILTSRRAA
jgi:hypothetical protein